jgi:CheY-like chemotaxis protein
MGTPVLIVDDDDCIRVTLRDLLEDEGYTVYEAPDGTSALQRLREHPDGMVVLLDVNMPGIDGLEVLRTVEAESSLAAQHVYILLSAGFRQSPATLALELHQLNVSTLDKPFDVELLLFAVSGAAQRLARSPGGPNWLARK